MDIFKKKTEIELAIWNIDRNYKVPAETIVSTIYDLHIKNNPEEEENDDSEGYSLLSFKYDKAEKGGTIFTITRDLADEMDGYEIKIDLIFEDISYTDEHLRIYGNYSNFMEEITQDPIYNMIKCIIPNQFKVRTKTSPY